jgi:GNAT superfamily N-acetyltransferase
MPLESPPPPPAAGVAREATDEPDAFVAAELAVALDTREQPPDVAERLVGGRTRLRASRAGTRTFLGARDGVDACTVTLYSDGHTAQIEDVATLVEHRRHGLAAATISLAIAEALAAGHELVFLYVDADEGPVPLYERLGFRTAGQCWTFTRPG